MSATPGQVVPDLEVKGLYVRYGHVRAVEDVSFSVAPGTVVAILGANGAGKSSTLRALAGGLRARIYGDIKLFGEHVARKPPHRIVSRGMVLVPEGRKVIAPLTVEENLLLAGQRLSRQAARAKLKEVHELFPALGERRGSLAGLLSGGEQQMLALGRALMAGPRVILMDEPSMGLSPLMVDRVVDAIASINQRGTSVLLVEQNANAAFRVATEVHVLDQGHVVRSGTTADVSKDPIVAEAFLGLRDRAPSIPASTQSELESNEFSSQP